jgi:hypothetical protein
MPHGVTIRSLPAAFALMKAMQGDGLGWSEDCRPAARRALAEIIEGRLREAVDARGPKPTGATEATGDAS